MLCIYNVIAAVMCISVNNGKSKRKIREFLQERPKVHYIVR